MRRRRGVVCPRRWRAGISPPTPARATSCPRGTPISARATCGPVTVALRAPDGSARCAAEVDAEFTDGVERVLRSGRRALLVLTDLSKSRAARAVARVCSVAAPAPWRAAGGAGGRLPVPARADDAGRLPCAGFHGGHHGLQVRHRPGVLRRFAAAARGRSSPAPPFVAGPAPLHRPQRLAGPLAGRRRAGR